MRCSADVGVRHPHGLHRERRVKPNLLAALLAAQLLSVPGILLHVRNRSLAPGPSTRSCLQSFRLGWSGICTPRMRSGLQTCHTFLPEMRTSAEGGRESVFKRMWSQYNTAIEENPLRTKMLTAVILAVIGDIMAQTFEGAKTIALGRVAKLGVMNIVYVVPMLIFFYGMNEKLIGALGMQRGSWLTVLVQLSFDQLINAPIVVGGFFVSFACISAVGDWSFAGLGASIVAKLREEYLTTIVANWKVWVLPQLFNFAVVPPSLRVAFANCVFLVWTTILSVLLNK